MAEGALLRLRRLPPFYEGQKWHNSVSSARPAISKMASSSLLYSPGHFKQQARALWLSGTTADWERNRSNYNAVAAQRCASVSKAHESSGFANCGTSSVSHDTYQALLDSSPAALTKATLATVVVWEMTRNC